MTDEVRAILVRQSEKLEWLAERTRPVGFGAAARWEVHREDGITTRVSVWRWCGEEEPSPAAPLALEPPRVVRFPVPHPPSPIKRHGTWPGTYQAYTATKEFRRLAAIAKRDWNFQCLIDITHPGPVEMHHRTYARVPFGESWWDLIPLCEDCHRRYHHRLALPPAGLFDEQLGAAA